MWIAWIDREGAIITRSFSFFGDLPLTLVLLLVLQRFGRRQWGHISELAEENQTIFLHPTNIDGTLDEEEVGIVFYPKDKIHSSWSLLGRATTVIGASRNEKDRSGDTEVQDEANNDTVGGVSRSNSDNTQWTQGESGKRPSVKGGDDAGGTGQTEHDPRGAMNNPDVTEAWRRYNEARDAYREACGSTIKEHNLVLKVSWPETSRPAEWEIISHAQTLGKNDKFIKGHIPTVKYAREFDRYSTHQIRDFLGLLTSKNVGTRTLRLIVMKRLRPIYDLEGKQFWDAFWQCVACMYAFLAGLPTITDTSPQVIIASG